ncbi:two-component system sensor histidine kinase CreC [Pseudothauera nasutitermitis]|uniref:histidine kinase n=1 Tax=Pseudothauera nasutitermitis TaxID=2565930 RepID=A0A4S4B2H1_9RHOO|nr:two-component system sensor histidine kinase CreC [Pseudothauera nasutitermitis]THF66840.1 two-component system sensor histidine kinase CreC [Pseudothauera nasutitermitis]
MNISVRLFFGYFLIVGLAAWFVLNTFVKESELGIRQATEETLVDTAQVLAEMAAGDLAAGRIEHGPFAEAVREALRRRPQAEISGVYKESVDLRIYVTDARGIVVYDSKRAAVGEDFSQWRDIARVLRGEYGARQTREDPYDPSTSVMHVAAPVVYLGERIGVLSLAKPMSSLAPYIERAAGRVKASGLILLAATAAIGLLFTAWLSWSIHRLRDYARAVASGHKAKVPTGGGRQLSELACALATMREKLEGKQYVERYVQNLTHEMKSPLTAIRGAAEILEGDPPAKDRRRFVDSIVEQAQRLQATIERMLMLARVEQLQAAEGPQTLQPAALLKGCLELRRPALAARGLHARLQLDETRQIKGDAFLLQQALLNLLDNAIEFSPDGGDIELAARGCGDMVEFSVRDHGDGAPDYALPQLFTRFYSLPRPASGKKSTGLGLALVREVARLHGGEAGFANHPEGGGEACFRVAAA